MTKIIFIFSLFLLFFSPTCAAHLYEYDQSLQKGSSLNVPLEFQNGTATIEDVSNWTASFGEETEPPILLRMDLDNDQKEEILAELRYARGQQNSAYLVFDDEEEGYRYLGMLSFSLIHVIKYKEPDRSYILTSWHHSAFEHTISLDCIKDKKIINLSSIVLKTDEPSNNPLFGKLFKGNVTEKELLQIFHK